MSKGSKPRPIRNMKEFRDNWDLALGKKKVKPRQLVKEKEEIKSDYNPFIFLKY